MADRNTKETNLSSKELEEAGPSTAVSRAGRRFKRKINYAENDDLLSIIFGEGEHQSEGQEDSSSLGPVVIPKKKAKNGKEATKPPSKKKNEKTTKGKGSEGEGHRSLQKVSENKTKGKSPKPKKKKWLAKVKFSAMASKLKKIPLENIQSYVVTFLNSEKHIAIHPPRKQILELLQISGELNDLVQHLFTKCHHIMMKCLKSSPKDRQSLYRIQYTFYVRDLVLSKSSRISRWFKDNFPDDILGHFSSIIHAIAAGVFSFVQSQIIDMNKEQQHQHNQMTDKDTADTNNSIESLLTIGGGCFGKIYKCVKRSIRKLRKTHYKTKEKQWRSKIKFRKFMFELVMTPNEKKNPNIPKALTERDRGWLFIPKWVFLPYLRMLDRCIGHTAHQNGLQLYGSKLIEVTSFNVNNCDQLETLFNATLEYIKVNFADHPEHFNKENACKFFKWWQNKIVHSRVGQLVQAHYTLTAHKHGKLTKGGTSIRDDLYQVEAQLKKQRVKHKH